MEVKDGKAYPILCDRPTHLYVLEYDQPQVTVYDVDMSNPKTHEEWLEIINQMVSSPLGGSGTSPFGQSQSDRSVRP